MQRFVSVNNGIRYVIEEDLPDVGWYLYAYQGENCIADYLQDSKVACVEFAKDEYGIETDSWLPDMEVH